MRAWWFAPADGKLRYGDGRVVKPGLSLSAEGPLEMCDNGMHACVLPLHALAWAPDNPSTVYRVELQGERIDNADKSCARTRLHLWHVKDLDAVLRKFVRMCALDVIHLWDAPEVVVRYLKTGDESIRDAARDAAWADARDAAREAAWDAAWVVAWDAARDAAWAVAWDAARDAAIKKQNQRLHRMLMQAERVTR